MIPLHEVSEIVKLIDTEGNMVARDWREGDREQFNRSKVSVIEDK